MSPRSAIGWPEWEEKNLLPWLDANQALSWKARSDAYYQQYRVKRGVESLRGKKYHILRKRHRTGARSPEHPGDQKRSGTVRRSVGGRGSPATLPNKTSAQRNIDNWFQTILSAEPSHTDDSNESTETKSSRPGTKYLLSFAHYKLILRHRPRDASTHPLPGGKNTIVILDLGLCTSCLCSQEAEIPVNRTSIRQQSIGIGAARVYVVVSKQPG
ncbi:hypothetical protein N7510_002696 [Penicillium lagena]|uniref:uncharacterized protein n=1 Tax=Penicillium lagena TaxID=94218 RepID=UPI002540F929|nr:uncharacterized protein N7510_002696 [Penicillium lagena]KAJ5626387.1 hypothetical protein N7510_002696 [Penicillium lagena]